MHIPTHIMSGWCSSNLIPKLGPRERLMCMIATTIPDLDGLSVLGGQQFYWDWHHVAGHNLPFGILVCVILVLLSGRNFRHFVLCFLFFHVHLLLDVFGSGPGWAIYYLWPFSHWALDNTHLSWEFYSWQNISIAGGLLVWAILIARVKRRTPLEAVMPDLDRQLVGLVYRRKTV